MQIVHTETSNGGPKRFNLSDGAIIIVRLSIKSPLKHRFCYAPALMTAFDDYRGIDAFLQDYPQYYHLKEQLLKDE